MTLAWETILTFDLGGWTGGMPLREFLRRFRNPLILILLATSAMSAFVGNIIDFVIFSVIELGITVDHCQ